MNKVKKCVRNVAIVVRLAFGSGRDLMYGIASYARKHCNWQLHAINFAGDETLEELRLAERKGLDGIIANGLDNDVLSTHLSQSSTPLVVIGARSSGLGRRTSNLAFVRNDDKGIGRFGAAYLESLGRARSYGFVNWNSHGYASILRSEGFNSYFADKTIDLRVYSTKSDLEKGSLEDISDLAKWLSDLPKPTVVMAVHDLRAIHVIEAAAMSGIRIPKELAIIGVDNDELLCDTANPTLTSIAPNHIGLGEIAARTLDNLMDGKQHRHTSIIRSPISAIKIVERQSAKPIVPATRLVDEAMSYIRHNALKGIGAADVVAHLGVSRRLADVRFRQLTGESILSTILRVRLDGLKRRLRDTDTPIAKITAACGFRGENYAKKLFRKRFGMSMSEWRRSPVSSFN